MGYLIFLFSSKLDWLLVYLLWYVLKKSLLFLIFQKYLSSHLSRLSKLFVVTLISLFILMSWRSLLEAWNKLYETIKGILISVKSSFLEILYDLRFPKVLFLFYLDFEIYYWPCTVRLTNNTYLYYYMTASSQMDYFSYSSNVCSMFLQFNHPMFTVPSMWNPFILLSIVYNADSWFDNWTHDF
jgi:hypothetical protein